jgi:apolipoprotein N-acyltransferase
MHPASGWPSQPASPVRSGGVRIPRPVIIGLALLTVGLLVGLTRSPRGLMVIAAACLLVALFDTHRGAGRLLRVVALLALLVFAAPAPVPERPAERRPRPPVKVEAVQPDRLKEARQRVAELWARAAAGFPRVEVSTTPKGGR